MSAPLLAAASLLAACGSSNGTGPKAGGAARPASSTVRAGSGYGGGAYGGGGYAPSASSTTGSSASSSATEISTKTSKLGTILAAGPKRLTVYLFEGDAGLTSKCTGACASAWPPVAAGGSTTVQGQAVAADLGTITRSDGTKQVTYKGHPLYYFVRDKDSGDAYGEGAKAFGAAWYVLAPSGVKIDNS